MNIKGIVWLIVLVQFVNALDFVIVMPLGPDIASALKFEFAKIAWLASVYTISAAIVALMSFLTLDMYDRKKVLVYSLSAMCIATFLGAMSNSLTVLLVSRFLAGGAGGLAIAIGLAIIADEVPESERGKALGMVMAGFPLSAILGIPIALYISGSLSWHWGFYFLSFLIFIITVIVIVTMPQLVGHRKEGQGIFQLSALSKRREMAAGIFLIGACVFPAFLIVPHASTITQYNYLFPRDLLSLLYLATGVMNLVFVAITGKLADRYSPVLVSTFWVIVYSINVALWLILQPNIEPALMHIAFFVSFTALLIPVASLTSKIPQANERAAFSALQSFIQYVAIGIASTISYFIVVSDTGLALNGLREIGMMSLIFVVIVPFAIGYVERKHNNSRQTNPSFVPIKATNVANQ